MSTRFALAVALVATLSPQAPPQPVSYRLDYSAPGATRVHVAIHLAVPSAAPASFVMPRSYPGGYSVVHYDAFVENLQARSAAAAELTVARDADGPRWTIGARGQNVSDLEYDVDVARMEHEILSGVESSKLRPTYAGVLGYSVFGYVDGQERSPVRLAVTAPSSWPVLTTLSPGVPAPIAQSSGEAPHFDELADSQILMGTGLQLLKLDGAIPLVMAVYAEAPEDITLEGQLARTALDRVQAYFVDAPLSHYTVQLELLSPLAGHDYGFSQEHYDSGTFSLDTSRAITAATGSGARATTLFNYAHHMAHSWVPKRAYGAGYSPFTWEMPPVIDTIWFNEGFGRYAAIAAVAMGMPAADGTEYRSTQLANLRRIVDAAPPFIKRMSTATLSREASFMYSDDFRTGRNIYSRGALMAADMDDRIVAATNGTKSLRDALRALVAATTATGRPFDVDRFPELIQSATGVDVRAIFERWMTP
jgi:predicted metalloprotease with PDZ domain